MTQRTSGSLPFVALMIQGNQIRTGMALDIEGKIYRVMKSQHVKPGKGGAYVQVRWAALFMPKWCHT